MKFVFGSLLCFFLTTGGTLTAMGQHSHREEAPSVHGMLLFGGENIFLSHLPMFHSPHDYQVILEVNIDPEIKMAYLESVRKNPSERIYTLVPDVFVLPEVIESKTSFSARIYRGHFERGGIPITGIVKIHILKIVFFNKLIPESAQPTTAKYLFFGGSGEVFAAHFISGRPDYDHVVEIKPTTELMAGLRIHNFLEIDFIESDNSVPIKPGSSQKTHLQTEAGPIDFGQIQIGREIYLEFGDLSL